MNKYSVTYVGILVMALSTLLNRLGLTIGPQEVQTTINVLLAVLGACIALYGRWRHKDINIWGFKKPVVK